MNKKFRVGLILLLAIGAVVVAAYMLRHANFAVLNPKGPIAGKEKGLIIFGSLLTLIVIVPVFVLTFLIAWKYRAGNLGAKYTPDWDHNRLAETVWWGIPTAIIFTLSVVTWQSSHQLDPSKPLTSNVKPITVQVVALDWKWLFIYPGQNIAAINYLEFPSGTPINFELTSDAPMNSFWIPQLGGQIYAMPGMSTKLHLMADGSGTYNGSSANISGKGFAGMKFLAKSVSRADFDAWVTQVKRSPSKLDSVEYDKLALPSQDNPVRLYSQAQIGLFDDAITKYSGNYGHMAGMP